MTRIDLHTGIDRRGASGLDRVRAVVAAVARTKDLVNASPAELFPASFADIAVKAAAEAGATARVWDEASLEADGFGGILGVGRGSSRGPRLVRLEWAPAGASVHLALVGKGITFDSGGLSLKPMASMVGMKTDMAGAAAVLADDRRAGRAEGACSGLRVALPRREHALRHRDPAERRAAHPRREDRRGPEHGRRGSAGARRCPRRGERRTARRDRRRRDAHRRPGRRARPPHRRAHGR